MSGLFRPLLLAAGTCVAWLPAYAQNAPAGTDNPHYKQAQQDLDNNDAGSAADEYEAALAADPKLADAHYELGVLYAEKLSEPIAALYHLDRFLKLAPNSPNAPAARDLVTTESEAFAASLPGSSTSSALARLQLENADLKKQATDASHTIATLQTQLATMQQQVTEANARAAATPEPATGAPPAVGSVPPASGAPTSAAPVLVPTPTPAATPGGPAVATPDAGGARTYTVRSGDSLWKIAHKMYPHDTTNGEEKIKDANKDAFSVKFLKPGQVLVIPE
ncbi:MAG TPA: LysM peptidoglycan-binding domain-containing protein [Candidatus Methylacidiphilales bacterium]|jgi:tetratricopeptide (TPR) repeat protein|nr:LysM peptidoglycan-binding domain-containing protein [Candidatus Methylacidiphilales bacterium]